jgi:LacI family transcriptional regulator, galactose operon repressor
VATRDGRVTLATVAAAAGVSVPTVSKVLNGRSDVAPSTRGLVESLLQQYEYRVPAAATPARRPGARLPTVELAFGGHLNAYSTEILQGVLDAAEDLGVAVVVSAHPHGERERPPVKAASRARDLAAAGRRAVIAVVEELTAADVDAFERARLPLVVVDPFELSRAGITSVGSTNFAGGLSATQHLRSLGHRRIAYLGGQPRSACNQARLHGYRAGMESSGSPVPTEYVRSAGFLYQDGLVEGGALLDLEQPPTAIFAGSDESAVGVLEAARARQLRVPEDLSVVGFDDTQVARHSTPPLTTVRQPLLDMGKVALRTALWLAAGETIDSHHVELATELIVRGSTGRARDD